MEGSAGKRHANEKVWNTWGRYAAIAAVYAAVYEIAYHLSFQQFLLTTGLRLACMLLLPTRYWPALAIGEGVPLVENAIFCVDKFGVLWALLASLPSVALWWPLLKLLRKRWTLYDGDGRLRMPLLLGATSGAAVITAAITTSTLVAALHHSPGRWPELDPETFFVGYLLGAYLGALTLTPMILALRERFRSLTDRRIDMALVWRSPLLRDVLFGVAPTMAVLTWVAVATPHDSVRQIARLALLLPVLALAFRHGWHGAAMAGMGASLALAVTAAGALDAGALQVQAVLAVVLSAALMVRRRMPALGAGIQVQGFSR